MAESATIGELAKALAKAQGEMDTAKKDSTNPHFKSKYADITSVIEAIREPLSRNGLAFIQPIERTEDGLALVTKVIHVSGEWISGSLPLILSKDDMQGLGSALTYARRYSLAAMFGIGQEDDDGNEPGSFQPAVKPPRRHDQGPPAPTPLPKGPGPVIAPIQKSGDASKGIIDPVKEEMHYIAELRVELGISVDDLKKEVYAMFKETDATKLTIEQLEEITFFLEKEKAARQIDPSSMPHNLDQEWLKPENQGNLK